MRDGAIVNDQDILAATAELELEGQTAGNLGDPLTLDTDPVLEESVSAPVLEEDEVISEPDPLELALELDDAELTPNDGADEVVINAGASELEFTEESPQQPDEIVDDFGETLHGSEDHQAELHKEANAAAGSSILSHLFENSAENRARKQRRAEDNERQRAAIASTQLSNFELTQRQLKQLNKTTIEVLNECNKIMDGIQGQIEEIGRTMGVDFGPLLATGDTEAVVAPFRDLSREYDHALRTEGASLRAIRDAIGGDTTMREMMEAAQIFQDVDMHAAGNFQSAFTQNEDGSYSYINDKGETVTVSAERFDLAMRMAPHVSQYMQAHEARLEVEGRFAQGAEGVEAAIADMRVAKEQVEAQIAEYEAQGIEVPDHIRAQLDETTARIETMETAFNGIVNTFQGRAEVLNSLGAAGMQGYEHFSAAETVAARREHGISEGFEMTMDQMLATFGSNDGMIAGADAAGTMGVVITGEALDPSLFGTPDLTASAGDDAGVCPAGDFDWDSMTLDDIFASYDLSCEVPHDPDYEFTLPELDVLSSSFDYSGLRLDLGLDESNVFSWNTPSYSPSSFWSDDSFGLSYNLDDSLASEITVVNTSATTELGFSVPSFQFDEFGLFTPTSVAVAEPTRLWTADSFAGELGFEGLNVEPISRSFNFNSGIEDLELDLGVPAADLSTGLDQTTGGLTYGNTAP